MQMIIAKTIAEIQSVIREKRNNNQKIGFIPTMGALHPGHISLVEQSKKENDWTVVSIFVNPTQFNNRDDLNNYPRTPEKDFTILEKAGTDLVFCPSDEEMYPDGLAAAGVPDFGNLEKVMEGKFRPGHFKGVAQVVSRLFEIVDPDNAYFGEKDFQQLAVIRELVRQKRYRIQIKSCPTIRETGGLAMSSRNLLLTPEMRKEATIISRALLYVRDQFRKKDWNTLKREAIEMIEHSGKLRVEYLEAAAEDTLQPLTGDGSVHGQAIRILTAVYAGNIRLIDNVQL